MVDVDILVLPIIPVQFISVPFKALALFPTVITSEEVSGELF